MTSHQPQEELIILTTDEEYSFAVLRLDDHSLVNVNRDFRNIRTPAPYADMPFMPPRGRISRADFQSVTGREVPEGANAIFMVSIARNGTREGYFGNLTEEPTEKRKYPRVRECVS